MFGADVEDFMTEAGYHNEAVLCCLLREWYESEDEPAISAVERCKKRLNLRAWLLHGIDFGHFPPSTRYIRGIPAVTYENLLTHLDRKIQIHAFLPQNAYNVRSLGSQECEQFFGTIRDFDPSGTGTPKPDDVPFIMAQASELDNIKLDPDRPFFMRTSKGTVYPEAEFHKWKTEVTPPADLQRIPVLPVKNIFLRDHYFDTLLRRRTLPRRKKSTVSQPGMPSLGEQGVRQFHRKDESKILAHVRRGLGEIPE